MILIWFLVFNILVGLLMCFFFGRYDWKTYRTGKMIYRHQKVTRFLLRFLTAILMCWLLPGPSLKNLFVIATTFWFFFDAYMGFKIKRNVYYTGSESLLDDIGSSLAVYFWFKFFLMSGSFIYYLV